MRIRSRIIYPVCRPPFENGGLFVLDGKILAVGDWEDINRMGTGEVIDLGEVITMPGLINAHCHLDYTNMAGKIPPPRNFPDWIKSILALKAAWSFSEYAQSWLHGAEMLLRTGTTTVGDIEAVPELLPDLWGETPLRLFSFLEMTGVKDGRMPSQVLQETLQKIENLPVGKNKMGLSPHALYSTKPELLRLSGEAGRREGLMLTMHVAESREEFAMFGQRSGPLFTWLQNQREMDDCGDTTPVQQLHRLGLLNERFLAVHLNYLGHGDAAMLAEHTTSVVHCPSSHAYFKHDPFPFESLRNKGVNLCLGTDSLASCSVPKGGSAELNMFLEMQGFARNFPAVHPEQIVQMVTTNSARALGMNGLLGALTENALADFICIPNANGLQSAAAAIVGHQGAVTESWISGRRCFQHRA